MTQEDTTGPEWVIRHYHQPGRYPRRWVVGTAVAGAVALLPFVLPPGFLQTWTGPAALTWFLLLGMRLLAGGTTAAWGLEGRTALARSLGGVHGVDLDRLQQVFGARLRNEYFRYDLLQLVDVDSRTVTLRADPDWPRGGLKADTLHVLRREVRKVVAAGRVPHVNEAARLILDVEGPVSDAPGPNRFGRGAQLYSLALVVYGVLLAVVVA